MRASRHTRDGLARELAGIGERLEQMRELLEGTADAELADDNRAVAGDYLKAAEAACSDAIWMLGLPPDGWLARD